MHYYILKGKKFYKIEDMFEYFEWCQQTKENGERNNQILYHNFGTVAVSTVFLGIDHGFGRTKEPILFETMIFGIQQEYQTRYYTYEEAEEGHYEALRFLATYDWFTDLLETRDKLLKKIDRMVDSALFEFNLNLRSRYEELNLEDLML